MDSVSTIINIVTLDITANGYRLPVEVEWEYAARGGTALETYNFSGGDDCSTVAWVYENSDLLVHPVKTDKKGGINSANSLGIYDMCGNVNEWCWDRSSSITSSTPITGPTSTSSKSRVKKGGGWDSAAANVTIDRHSGTNQTANGSDTNINGKTVPLGFGFRVVQTAGTN